MLGWKGLSGTNALVYYEKSYLMAMKSFITLATGLNIKKLFMAVIVISWSVCPCPTFPA